MAYINTNKQKQVFVDASTGLVAILIQCQNVVAYARKALTDIEIFILKLKGRLLQLLVHVTILECTC